MACLCAQGLLATLAPVFAGLARNTTTIMASYASLVANLKEDFRGSAAYLDIARPTMSQEVFTTCEGRNRDNLIRKVNAMRGLRIADAGELTTLIQGGSWEVANKQRLSSAVSEKVSDQVEPTAVRTNGQRSNQDISHFQNYLTEEEIRALQATKYSHVSKLQMLAKRCKSLRVDIPSEQSRGIVVCTMLALEGDVNLDPRQKFALLSDFQTALSAELRATPAFDRRAHEHIVVYPESPQFLPDFLIESAYPGNLLPEAREPVDITAAMLTCPLRKNSKLISGDFPNAPPAGRAPPGLLALPSSAPALQQLLLQALAAAGQVPEPDPLGRALASQTLTRQLAELAGQRPPALALGDLPKEDSQASLSDAEQQRGHSPAGQPPMDGKPPVEKTPFEPLLAGKETVEQVEKDLKNLDNVLDTRASDKALSKKPAANTSKKVKKSKIKDAEKEKSKTIEKKNPKATAATAEMDKLKEKGRAMNAKVAAQRDAYLRKHPGKVADPANRKKLMPGGCAKCRWSGARIGGTCTESCWKLLLK